MPPRLMMASPIHALRDVSRDETYRWMVTLADGTEISAIDLQREYLALAECYRGESIQTDWTLNEWARILDDLAKDPLACGDRVAWVAKLKIVEEYRAEEGLDWDDDALHSVDLEYHNIDPDASLFHAWQGMGNTKRILNDIDIISAMTDPPQNTRAKGRAQLVEKVIGRKGPRFYLFDWNGVALDRHTYVEMLDPFETYENATD